MLMQAVNERHNKDLKLVPLQIIFVLAIFQFIISFLTEPMMLTFDESMWQYIGRNWIRNGLVPYAGGVDNKSPLIFLVFGISDRLFGVNYWFPRLVGIAVQSVGIYGLFKIAEKTIESPCGHWLQLVFMVFHCSGIQPAVNMFPIQRLMRLPV